MDFLDYNNTLYKFQFGFRPNHSTEQAILTIIDRITQALERGEFVIGLFLDFSKAFDTVDHEILLRKLHFYGIRGNALKWFESYLADRKQYVVYNGVSSSLRTVQCGVPQGSILGPILFLIYVNDLAFCSTKLFFLLFADDTNVFLSGHDLFSIQDLINQELRTISVWLSSNKLSLNVSKTHFMLFRSSSTFIANRDLSILINNTHIEEVSCTKFLGVIIDNRLSWHEHTTYIQRKICKSIGILSKARKSFSKETLVSLYYTFIYPYLSYCITAWGNTYKTHLQKLILIQKRAIRIVSFSQRLSHTAELFSNTGILTLSNMYQYHLGIFMFKISKGLLSHFPDYMFSPASDIHRYETRQYYHIPAVRLLITKKSIRYQGAYSWNVIVRHIDHKCSIHSFKKRLKMWLSK